MRKLVAFPSLSGQPASFSSVLVRGSASSSWLQAVVQDLVQYSVVLATTLQGQRSNHSEYSPAVTMLATHLPFSGPNRIARQTQGFKGQGQLVTPASGPPTSSTLVQRFVDGLRTGVDHQRQAKHGRNSAPLPWLP